MIDRTRFAVRVDPSLSLLFVRSATHCWRWSGGWKRHGCTAQRCAMGRKCSCACAPCGGGEVERTNRTDNAALFALGSAAPPAHPAVPSSVDDSIVRLALLSSLLAVALHSLVPSSTPPLLLPCTPRAFWRARRQPSVCRHCRDPSAAAEQHSRRRSSRSTSMGRTSRCPVR